MRTFFLLLSLSFLVACKEPRPTVYPAPTAHNITLPLFPAFPKYSIPEDNPWTEEGIALGRQLFYSPKLSSTLTQSCSSCHQQDKAFSSTNVPNFSLPTGQSVQRGVPSLQNLLFRTKFLQDARATKLEEASQFCLQTFLGANNNYIVLKNDVSMQEAFGRAFGDEKITEDRILKALNQFLWTLISIESDMDRFVRNELIQPLPPEVLQGQDIFYAEDKGDCFHCHGNGALFSYERLHNNGLDQQWMDFGHYYSSLDTSNKGQFLTPTLRNVAQTAPYMHDGRFSTLEEVVEFYSTGVQESPTIDPFMKKAHQGGVQLSTTEKVYLVAYLKSLTDTTYLNNRAYSQTQ